MLLLFERVAKRLHRLRVPLWLGFFAMLVICGWLLLMASVAVQDRWLIPVVLLTLWFLLGGSSLLLFNNVPPAPEEGSAWFSALRRRLHRFCYHVFAWFMLLVSLSLVVISFQLAMAWFRAQALF